MNLLGLIYFCFSVVGFAWLQWYYPNWHPTAFWQVPVLMLAGVAWFLLGIAVNEAFTIYDEIYRWQRARRHRRLRSAR